jgi:hypothetical protein
VLAQVRDAKRILDAAARGLGIAERRAVLRDVEGNRAVPLPHPAERFQKTLRVDLPVHLRVEAGLGRPSGTDGPVRRRGVHDAARVVVDSEEVDRPPDRFEVCRREVGPGLAEDLGHLRGVSAEKDRVEVLAVHVGIRAPRRLRVRSGSGRRRLGLQVHDEPDAVPPLGAVGRDRPPVRAQEVVGHERCFEEAAMPGREPAAQIADMGDDPGLVQRRPVPDAAVECAEEKTGVVREPIGGVPILPAAAVVERGRKIPVIERRERSDPRLEEPVHEPLVEVDARPVDASGAAGKDPRPGDAEAIRRQAEPLHPVDVFAPAAVVIARNVSGLVRLHPAGRVGEAVPDRGTGPVGER